MTPRQKELVSRMRSGDLPALNYQGELYMTGGGKPPNRRTLNALIKKGIVIESGDGLFDGFTQTFSLAG